MTDNNPKILNPIQRKLQNELNRFMGSILTKIELIAPNEYIKNTIRKQILDEGNNIIRQMDEILTSSITKVKLPIIEYKKLRSDVQE